MLVFGCCVGPSQRFDQVAGPALRDVMAPEDVLVREVGDDGICAAYNRVLAQARALPECDGVVLIHDDVELRSGSRGELLKALQRPHVGVVGVVGGRDLWGGQWFKASVRAGYACDSTGQHVFGSREADVDVVDGLLMAISPRAFSTIEFDAVGLPAFHGYDTDYCLRNREAGLLVHVANVDYVHHDKGGVGDETAFHAAQDRLWTAWHPSWIRLATPSERRKELRRQGFSPTQIRRRRLIRRTRSIVNRLRR